MRLTIVAVGQKVPNWAQTAYDDYAKRFPPELKVELKAVKTEPRASKTFENLLLAERLPKVSMLWRWMSGARPSPRSRWPNDLKVGSCQAMTLPS